MTNADILAYTGAIAGVVGAATGIAGAILGYIGFKRSAEIKALDLRIELRKAIAVLFEELQELPNVHSHAKKSHTAVAAATGSFYSGAMERWTAQWEADQKSIEAFDLGFADLNVDHSHDDYAKLEAGLVDAHSLLTGVQRLRARLEASVASDDRQRSQLREDREPNCWVARGQTVRQTPNPSIEATDQSPLRGFGLRLMSNVRALVRLVALKPAGNPAFVCGAR